MAMIAVKVPTETSRLISKISEALPGDSQAASEMHVTIIHLGDDVPISQLAKVMEACHTVTSKISPFVMTVDSIDSFEPGDNGGVPVILPVQSQELHELEQKLKQEFDSAGISYSNKYPEFKPHVTLSYVPGMKAVGPLPAPISWGAFEMMIYGADSGDGRVLVTLPFGLPNMQIKLQKIAARVARS